MMDWKSGIIGISVSASASVSWWSRTPSAMTSAHWAVRREVRAIMAISLATPTSLGRSSSP
jgi:uncharacterized iron-regulated membrane protein